MKVKAMKCPNCNANLKLKPGQTEGVCEYCKASYVIDDEVIRIEKKTTVEIKTDNDLEIAIATLDNFKEYTKSEYLFKNLIYRYGHKKEVYIGLVRSITHDFTKPIKNIAVFNEVNDYWEKYKSLAKPKDIAAYEESMNDLNKKYWHKLLIQSTANFNYKKSDDSIEEIENNWNNYLKYCSEDEKIKLEIKYKDFLKNKKQDVKQKKSVLKLAIVIVIIAIIIIFLIDFITLSKEKAIQTTNEIKVSELEENCNSLITCENSDFLKSYFDKTKSTLIIDNVSVDKENNNLDVTIKLKNRYTSNNQTYTFKLIDDVGPIISSTNCTYQDTDDIDLNTCFEVYDFTDKEISSDKIKIDYNETDLKSEGTKQITITATDNDGNTNTKNIDVNITKTPMTLNVEISNDLIVGKTAKLTYTFSPDNIPNKEVEITYDKEYLSIDANNNVKGLKKGTTNICVTSQYDGSKKCIDANITLECSNTITFNFNGGGTEKIVAGENFCTGTYKIYASVLNKKEMYTLTILPKNDFKSIDYITIAKDSSFLNEEGTTIVFNEGTAISAPAGITQVKLVKVS